MLLVGIFYVAYIIALIVAVWKIYEKAGQPGWAAIIPLYNMYILLKVVGKPAWWLILFFIPVVNMIFGIWTYNLLSKSFGKNELTTLLMFIGGIGMFQIGFGNAQYQGPYGDPASFKMHQNRYTFDFEQIAI